MKLESMKPLLACVAFFASALSAPAQAPSAPRISQLFAFYCNSDYSYCPKGFQPALGPLQLSNGKFYGTTWYGDTESGLGTIWYATTSGDFHVLYNFTSEGAPEYGKLPAVALVAGPHGDLYGVTVEGGTQNSGTFYSITTGGNLQALYNFCSLSGCPDTALPIVLGGDSNFYGITPKLVFKLTPEGAWSPFYTFALNEQGEQLIAGTDGNLYGAKFTNPFKNDAKESVFRLTTGGVYTKLHTFPTLDRVSALVQSSKGTLYGVLCCGDNTGIFQINSAGKYKLLQQTPQGALPATLLVVGSDGSIYGLITGSGYPGSVFAITPQGKTIFSEELNCATVGCEPLSLIEATNGNFYGLNFSGGTVPTGDNANGTVFKVATKRK